MRSLKRRIRLTPAPASNYHSSYYQLAKQILIGPSLPDTSLHKSLCIAPVAFAVLVAGWLQPPGPAAQSFPEWALDVAAAIFCFLICLFFNLEWRQYPAMILFGMITFWIYIDATKFHTIEEFGLFFQMLPATYWSAALLSMFANTYQLLPTAWLPFRVGADKKTYELMLCGICMLFPCAFATGRQAAQIDPSLATLVRCLLSVVFTGVATMGAELGLWSAWFLMKEVYVFLEKEHEFCSY